MKQWNIHVSNINPGFMRTPIVTGGPDLTAKEFANVPKDLRAQYTDKLFEPSESLQNVLEDPQLVVDGKRWEMFGLITNNWCNAAIVDSLTDARPPMW